MQNLGHLMAQSSNPTFNYSNQCFHLTLFKSYFFICLLLSFKHLLVLCCPVLGLNSLNTHCLNKKYTHTQSHPPTHTPTPTPTHTHTHTHPSTPPIHTPIHPPTHTHKNNHYSKLLSSLTNKVYFHCSLKVVGEKRPVHWSHVASNKYIVLSTGTYATHVNYRN